MLMLSRPSNGSRALCHSDVGQPAESLAVKRLAPSQKMNRVWGSFPAGAASVLRAKAREESCDSALFQERVFKAM